MPNELPGLGSDVCGWCDRPAKFLCDYPAGPGGRTCSAPMCEGHRYRSASGIACTRGGKGRGCRSFTIDYCPDHAPKPTAGGKAA